MAYELLKFLDDSECEVVCTKESDMWAFGMVLYVGIFRLVLWLKLIYLRERR